MTYPQQQLTQWRSELHHFVRRQLPSDAEDITHDALVTLLKQEVAPDNPRAFLFTVARRRIADILRTKYRDFDPVVHAVSKTTGIATREAREDAIDQALDVLPANLFWTFALRHGLEFKLEEVAEILEVDRSTVNARLRKARELMGKVLEEHVAREEIKPR